MSRGKSKKYRDSSRKRLQYCLGREVVIKGTIMKKIYDENGKLYRLKLGRIFVYDTTERFICKINHINIHYRDIIKLKVNSLNFFIEDLPYSFKGRVSGYTKQLKEGMIAAEAIDFGIGDFTEFSTMDEYPEDIYSDDVKNNRIIKSPLSKPKNYDTGFAISEVAATRLFNRTYNK